MHISIFIDNVKVHCPSTSQWGQIGSVGHGSHSNGSWSSRWSSGSNRSYSHCRLYSRGRRLVLNVLPRFAFRIPHNLFQKNSIVVLCRDWNDSAASQAPATEHNHRVTASVRQSNGQEITQNVEGDQQDIEGCDPEISQCAVSLIVFIFGTFVAENRCQCHNAQNEEDINHCEYSQDDLPGSE